MSRRTIQSPGVEIREIDLSQRPAAALGTSVFIAGFSNQGPTDEIFNVGTFAEFEEIYGKPTNAAERYFYHSTKQVFDSDANVLVSRLPYGTGDGTATEKYSALVYPVSTANVVELSGSITTTNTGTSLSASFGTAVNVSSSNIGVGGAAEIITEDASGNIKYTSWTGSVSGGGTYLTIDDNTVSSNVSGDTLVGGVFLSGGAGPTSLASAQYFMIGNPTHVELTRAEYLSASEGNVSWSDTPGTTSLTKDNLGSSGLVILNKAKVSTNNSFEGYYVGVTDNSVVSPASNHELIRSVKTVTASAASTGPSGFATVPSSRYEFSLSSTPTNEKSSVSKTLENLSKFDIDGGQFVDTLNIGIFKMRITPFANTVN